MHQQVHSIRSIQSTIKVDSTLPLRDRLQWTGLCTIRIMGRLTSHEFSFHYIFCFFIKYFIAGVKLEPVLFCIENIGSIVE